jgi:threonine/homoserine/homoserine lactone efflux protein
MDWSAYASFVGLAVLLILVPGADFTVVTRNALLGGRRRGWWSAVGVTTSNAVQGTAAAAGLATVIVRIQPLFQAIRWAGIGYLLWLAVQALRAAARGTYPAAREEEPAPGQAFAGWRQGFLSNITNPKVLVFYLAVLPQFLDAGTAPYFVVSLALTHALLSLLWLLVVVRMLTGMRTWFARRRVRRGLDGATGVLLLGFSARLAAEHV